MATGFQFAIEMRAKQALAIQGTTTVHPTEPASGGFNWSDFPLCPKPRTQDGCMHACRFESLHICSGSFMRYSHSGMGLFMHLNIARKMLDVQQIFRKRPPAPDRVECEWWIVPIPGRNNNKKCNFESNWMALHRSPPNGFYFVIKFQIYFECAVRISPTLEISVLRNEFCARFPRKKITCNAIQSDWDAKLW